MTESNPYGPAESDVDPRFDPAAAGTEPPRPEAAVRSAQEQFDEIAAACRDWVRSNPWQAIGVAAGLGFLLGRGGR